MLFVIANFWISKRRFIVFALLLFFSLYILFLLDGVGFYHGVRAIWLLHVNFLGGVITEDILSNGDTVCTVIGLTTGENVSVKLK